MFVRPGVEVKPIEGNAPAAHRNRNEVGPYVPFKDRRADAQVSRCLGRAKQPREKDGQH